MPSAPVPDRKHQIGVFAHSRVAAAGAGAHNHVAQQRAKPPYAADCTQIAHPQPTCQQQHCYEMKPGHSRPTLIRARRAFGELRPLAWAATPDQLHWTASNRALRLSTVAIWVRASASPRPSPTRRAACQRTASIGTITFFSRTSHPRLVSLRRRGNCGHVPEDVHDLA